MPAEAPPPPPPPPQATKRRSSFGRRQQCEEASLVPTPPHILALPSQVHGCVAGDRRTIYVVRRKDLLHVPATPEYSLEAYRRHFVLTLCPAFAAHGDCTAGPQCRQAHAKLHGSFGRFTPHFVPDDPERVPASERFAADLPAICVGFACQLSGRTATTVRPADCYATRARVGTTHDVTTAIPAPLLSHCKHWLQAGMCHYGATCRFVHALDPSAARSFWLASASPASAQSRDSTAAAAAAAATTAPLALPCQHQRQQRVLRANASVSSVNGAFLYQHSPYEAVARTSGLHQPGSAE